METDRRVYCAWNIFKCKHPDIHNGLKYGWRIGPHAIIYPTKWGFTFYKDGKKVGGAYFFYSTPVADVLEKLEIFYVRNRYKS